MVISDATNEVSLIQCKDCNETPFYLLKLEFVLSNTRKMHSKPERFSNLPFNCFVMKDKYCLSFALYIL